MPSVRIELWDQCLTVLWTEETIPTLDRDVRNLTWGTIYRRIQCNASIAEGFRNFNEFERLHDHRQNAKVTQVH